MPSTPSASELLRKVRKIEIRTRALSHQIFAGEYHSAFKGRGMAFSEVREYQDGDDPRSMDWNVTARLRAPYVKVYEEEREMTVVLLIDISRSGLFGTRERTKRELIAEIAAVLSFSAIINNDKVGALLFSDHVEKFIPPKKGRSHLLHIIREIIELKPSSDGTDVGEALRYLTNAIKKKCTAFVLSDMLDVDRDGSPRYEEALKVARNRHDISVIKVHDPREQTIPSVGLVHVKDSETGESAWVNTSSRKVRAEYSRWFGTVNENERKLFNRYQIDSVDIATDDDYVTYKFSFLDYGREVCSYSWVGVYPRFVRNSIDLSNKRGKLNPDEIYRVGFEQYILHKLVEGRSDLVWKLVKEICYTCSENTDSWYTLTEEFTDTDSGKVYLYNNKTFSKKIK